MSIPSTHNGRRRFPEMSALAYQHPSDLDAMEAIKKIPIAASLWRKISETWLERWHNVSTLGDNLRLGPRQCPRVYNLFVEAASILDMPMPEIYLDTGHQVNAFAFGMKKYTVTIYSGLIDLMDEEELLAVIGHELSHIKCEHMLYKSMTEVLGRFGVDMLGQVLGVGANLLTLPLLAALASWSRKAELSCDRAGLLVTQNPETTARALAKLGGMSSPRWQDTIDLNEVVKQAEDYEKLDDSIIDKGMLAYLSWQRSHPYPIYRAKKILDWARSDDYQRILSGDYVTHAKAALMRQGALACPRCGYTVTSQNQFCPGCGQVLAQQVMPPMPPPPMVAPAPVSGPTGLHPRCTTCSAEVHADWKFCRSCGTPNAAQARTG